MDDKSNRIELPPARTGRPSGGSRHYAPDELVRFDARIPARLGKQLYDVALTDGRSVTAVHADLLAAALEAPTAGMTAAEKARRHEAFDAREPYRFVPHAKRDTTRGTQRFRGPAVDGHPFKVRCPNTSASMREPHTIPTTTCL